MDYCTVTSRNGKSELHVVIVDHCKTVLPALVQAEADAIKADKKRSSATVVVNEGRYLICKRSDKAWLVGGEDWRLLGKSVVEALREIKGKSAAIEIDASASDAQALTEGILLADYRCIEMRSGDAAKRARITIRIPGQAAAIKKGAAVAESQNLARRFMDLPANRMNPKVFVTEARKALRGLGLEVEVVQGLKALEKARFPGLVQVGKGGATEPAMMRVRYKPSRPSKKKLALVGKGITFDSGGISLKPGAKMWTMKGDMGGAVAALGAIKLIAQLKPRVDVTAYMALAENMPDAQAQRPGDIYKARNGKFIHVDNTDAEGRLVLADVLTYACEKGATHVVDAATLTGACLVALGPNVAAVMSPDEEWCTAVREAGQAAGEELWPLPLYGEYRESLDHVHADINNIGGRAGTITAGLFLSEFVDEKVKWAHCDIAGPAFQADAVWRYYAKGGTGFAVRTFAALACRLAGK